DGNRAQGGAAGEQQIDGVLNPGQWMISKHDVTDSAASESGHAAQHADSEPIHFAFAGRKRSGHGFRNDGDDKKNVQKGRGFESSGHGRIISQVGQRPRSCAFYELKPGCVFCMMACHRSILKGERMRERLDCAVLLTDCTIGWVEPLLGQHAGGRLHLHPLEHVVRVEDDASAQALAGSSMALRRFDACVIPVWPASLSWARMSLAQGAGKLHTPVLALAHELSTAGLYDLHQLGVADFLRNPFCSHEARMRIERLLDGRRATLPPLPAPGLHVSEARPAGEDPFSRPLAPGNTPEQGASVWDLDGYAVAAASCSSSSSESFQEAKKRVIERFERAYLNAALGRHG